jgi:hypothetical protein
MSEFGFEHGFPFVSFFDSYVIVALSYVHFGEVAESSNKEENNILIITFLN